MWGCRSEWIATPPAIRVNWHAFRAAKIANYITCPKYSTLIATGPPALPRCWGSTRNDGGPLRHATADTAGLMPREPAGGAEGLAIEWGARPRSWLHDRRRM